MDHGDVNEILQKRIFIKGVPIEKTSMYITLSDMNVSDQDISDYSNAIHNLMKVRGKEEAEKKILTIFRINPLVAVRMIESSQMADDLDWLSFGVAKPIHSVLQGYDYFDNNLILNKKGPFVTLLIEAVFQKSIANDAYWNPNVYLQYAKREDLKLRAEGMKPKFLNAYNIRHILNHIPENHQIDLINWFWDKHCYAARKYGKTETYSSRKVEIMMSELTEGSIWQHLENGEKHELSQREQDNLEKEKEGIRKFVESVISEGRHVQFVKKILGRENFYDKLAALMGNEAKEEYKKAAVTQKVLEEKEEIGEISNNNKKAKRGNEIDSSYRVETNKP